MARKSQFIEHNDSTSEQDIGDGGDSTNSGTKSSSKGKPSWRSLFYFTTRKHLSSLILGSAFALLAGCATTALAIFLGDVFNAFTAFGAGDINSDGLQSKILTGCLGMIGLGSAGWFLNGAYYAAFIAFGEFQASTVRRNVFIELLSRDVEWFEAQQEGSGALLSGIQA